MPLDFGLWDGAAPHQLAPALLDRRRARGLGNYHAGLAAEDAVAQLYQRKGLILAARRWRGGGGEIDLILDHGETVIFVEVKTARSIDQAAGHIGHAQIQRLYRAADAYIEGRYGHQNIDRRFDLALVDAMGRSELIENAFML